MKISYFISIMLTALSAGLSFAHLLELPPRVYYFDAKLWITMTTGGLYYLFGLIGGPIEVGSVISTIVLLFVMPRRHKTSFYPAFTGAFCIILALTLWFLLIAPVSVELAQWTPADFPADWIACRNRWEYMHAANALIKIAGLSMLLLSVINNRHLAKV